MPKLMKRAFSTNRPIDKKTDTNYRKSSLFNNHVFDILFINKI